APADALKLAPWPDRNFLLVVAGRHRYSSRPGTRSSMTKSLKELVLAEARAAGFDVARVTAPAAVGAAVAERLDHFVQQGRHGDMAWMAATAERRRHPLGMW